MWTDCACGLKNFSSFSNLLVTFNRCMISIIMIIEFFLVCMHPTLASLFGINYKWTNVACMREYVMLTFGHVGHANSSLLSLKTLSGTSGPFASPLAFSSGISLSGFFSIEHPSFWFVDGSFGQVCHHMSSKEMFVGLHFRFRIDFLD